MNFNQKYPDSAPLEIEVEPQLEKSGRIFACDCGIRTGWRFVADGYPGIPCCSDECLGTMRQATVVREPLPLESFVGSDGRIITYESFEHQTERFDGTVNSVVEEAKEAV